MTENEKALIIESQQPLSNTIIPEYQQELNNLKQLWINKQITISEMFAKKGELNNRYGMVITEQLRPRTYLEQNI